MRIFSPPEINQMCLEFLDRINQFDFYLHDLFFNQYNTGLRYSDLYDLYRWEFVVPEIYLCHPAKGNSPRMFNNEELSFPFRESVRSNNSIYEVCRYTTTIRYFNRYFQEPHIKVGRKEISTHIFRHNKAKQLKQQEWNDEQIRIYFGEQNIVNTMGYIYSTVYTDD